MIEVQRLREVLDYDADTGVFSWKIPPPSRIQPGDVAGSVRVDGYRIIGIDRCYYYAHRLAWLYVHGELPIDGLDHRNEQPDDNRIKNLRLATDAQNSENRTRPQSNNRSGFRGVRFQAGRWEANIKKDRRMRYLGRFDTAEQASAAYLAAKRELHPFCEL